MTAPRPMAGAVFIVNNGGRCAKDRAVYFVDATGYDSRDAFLVLQRYLSGPCRRERWPGNIPFMMGQMSRDDLWECSDWIDGELQSLHWFVAVGRHCNDGMLDGLPADIVMQLLAMGIEDEKDALTALAHNSTGWDDSYQRCSARIEALMCKLAQLTDGQAKETI